MILTAKPKWLEDIETVKARLEKACKETQSKRMLMRYQAILWHLNGHQNKEIAALLGIDEHTVGIHIRKFYDEGMNGLALGHSPGAPKKLTADQEAQLRQTILGHTPDEVGFAPHKNWTIEFIRQWVKRAFHITYSHRGMAEVLYRLNLSYTRPTYTLAKADAEKQASFRQQSKALKKTCRTE